MEKKESAVVYKEDLGHRTKEIGYLLEREIILETNTYRPDPSSPKYVILRDGPDYEREMKRVRTIYDALKDNPEIKELKVEGKKITDIKLSQGDSKEIDEFIKKIEKLNELESQISKLIHTPVVIDLKTGMCYLPEEIQKLSI